MSSVMESKAFPFELLPAELREAIYEHILVTEKIQIRLVMNQEVEHYHSPNVTITGRDKYDPQRQAAAAILRTSRQVYNEALPVLYGKNIFSFTSITALRQFMRDVKAGIEYLRYVEIATTGRFAFWEPMNALLRAEGLRSLTISLGPDDVKDKGWSEVVLEVSDYIVRKAPLSRRRKELDRISFVPSGIWEASGNPAWRSCSSDGAAEQVRRRIERRLILTGGLHVTCQ